MRMVSVKDAQSFLVTKRTMINRFSSLGKSLPFGLGFQLGLGCIVLAATTITPAQGAPGMIVPLRSQSLAQVITWAGQHDASLIGRGPLPGTIVIQSETNDLALQALLSGSLLVAVGIRGCGDLSS